MDRAGLINAAAEKVSLFRRDTGTTINTAVEIISDYLAEGNKAQLMDFGAFEVKNRAEHIGHNPRTRESIKIPVSKMSVFKPGRMLKGITVK